eukprot:2049673-Pleurochrysis_carterae.AAC.1
MSRLSPARARSLRAARASARWGRGVRTGATTLVRRGRRSPPGSLPPTESPTPRPPPRAPL